MSPALPAARRGSGGDRRQQSRLPGADAARLSHPKRAWDAILVQRQVGVPRTTAVAETAGSNPFLTSLLGSVLRVISGQIAWLLTSDLRHLHSER